jgi:hypothetical protein
MNYSKDKDGVKIKYPHRNCQDCKKYPCFSGIEKCSVIKHGISFAAYGCNFYKDGSVSKASS